MNLVSLLNALALATAFISSWLCLQTDYEKFLIVLNYYFISHSIAVILDASIMLRLERTLAISSSKRGMSIFASAISNYIFYFFLILLFSFIEFKIFEFSFLMLAFTRHLSNISKNCFPHLHESRNFQYYSNAIAILRNLFIALAIYRSINTIEFITALIFISIVESLLILIIANSCIKNYNKISISKRILNVYRSFISIFKKSQGRFSIINFLISSYDRILIGLLFSESIQVLYFKLKVLQQLVDGFIGIFSYKIRLSIMKSANVIAFKKMLLPALLSLFICPVIWIYGREFSLEVSYIYVFLLVLAFVVKRSIESIIPIYVMRMNGYSFLVIKNLIEVTILCLVIFWMYYTKNISIQITYILNAYLACIATFMYNFWFRKVN